MDTLEADKNFDDNEDLKKIERWYREKLAGR